MRLVPAFSALFLLITSCSLSGQQLEPVSYTIPRQQQEVVPSLKTTANLVVVDVVARDVQGHPIRGLKADDFVLTEDKTTQTLRNFEEHTPSQSAAAPAPVLPPGVFTNFQTDDATGPINILLLDQSNTEPQDQSNVRRQLLQFVEKVKPGTRMALFELTTQLKILQGVTPDRQLILAALRDRDTGVAPPDKSNCMQLRQQSLKMVSAMNFLSLYLGNLPNRKNLLWFSGSFYFYLFPHPIFDESCYADVNDLRLAIDSLSKTQVSIYPMVERIGVAAVRPPSDDIKELARLTGGRAYSNAQDIDGETAAALDDGAYFYTLAYVPTDKKWDGAFRNIEVKLANGNRAELSYRRGYFADDPNGLPPKRAIFGNGNTRAKQMPHPGAMEMALMLGVPEPAQVAFVTRLQPKTAKEELTLAPGNNASKDTKGPYLRYAVHLAANLNTLKPVEDADGTRHLSLEFVTFVYDLKGSVVNSVGSTAQITLTAAQYQQALKDGLPLQSDISIPSKGDYTLRMAIHDLNNGHVGAIEIPAEAIKKLPPRPRSPLSGALSD